MLVGQYESFILPLAVILSLPVGLFGSFFFLHATGLANDVYAQIGLVMLVGLLGKNAILVVEFASQSQAQGMNRTEAVIHAGKVRLRPILMTAAAFILGVVPLVIAKGAGAEMRSALGIAVFSGMLGVTFFGIFLTPVFYVTIRWLAERNEAPPTVAPAVAAAPAPGAERKPDTGIKVTPAS